tara:strand:- start:150 stop:1424 length:1275 start_codon:yes stop_codon:yes gene_type:complete
MSEKLTFSASEANLRRLLVIRCLVLSAGTLALVYGMQVMDLMLPHILISYTLAFLALITLFSFWRLHYVWAVTDIEYLAQLLVDILGLSLLLYFSGGAGNPFISFYLVPLCISAAVLPSIYTWIVASLSLAAYSLLLFLYITIPEIDPRELIHNTSNNNHIWGMWINFTFSAALITLFVERMASALKEKKAQENEQREDLLRNEQILAVARLAAGTAHKLGTPLSTMAIVTESLGEHSNLTSEQQEDINQLEQQINQCKDTLKQLVQTARLSDVGNKVRIHCGEFITDLWEHWRMMRPEVSSKLRIKDNSDGPQIMIEATLEQAISNLLNNAADACPYNIDIQLSWDINNIYLKILDQGPGIPQEIIQQLNSPAIKQSSKGLGLGLLLSHATINRYKGKLELSSNPQGGTITSLTLPYNELQNG